MYSALKVSTPDFDLLGHGRRETAPRCGGWIDQGGYLPVERIWRLAGTKRLFHLHSIARRVVLFIIHAHERTVQIPVDQQHTTAANGLWGCAFDHPSAGIVNVDPPRLLLGIQILRKRLVRVAKSKGNVRRYVAVPLAANLLFQGVIDERSKATLELVS